MTKAYGATQRKRLYMGHRRLAVIDLAGGHQPMWTADGTLGVVYNGEIYNFAQLRSELEGLGHRFATHHSDTEVLLHGYRQWGSGLTSRLNGMWAFALYDARTESLFCSRDRFGEKPFYYTLQDGTFAFASELNALTRHRFVSATVSRRSLQKYFAYGYIPAPLSLYADIFKLPAGHSLSFSLVNGSMQVSRYWAYLLEPSHARPAGIEQRWEEELRHLLQRAVERRLVADVPIGVFLSGGVDSSAVAAYAAAKLGEDRLDTFSIGFEDRDFDESAYARLAARHIGSTHHQEVLSLDKAVSLLRDTISRLDEPMGDSSILPTHLLCRHARRTVTVALGGDGADELFGGYAPFRALRWARLYRRWVPGRLHTAIKYLADRMPATHGYMALDFKIKRVLRGLGHPPRLWNPVWMSPLGDRELSELFCEPVDLEDVFSEAIELWDDSPGVGLVDRTLQFFTRLYLQNDILTKVDRASMWHSLEVRSPYLDIDLVNFARTIPADCKLRRGTTKYLLKRALEPVLPRAILERSKQGFAVPIARWFRGQQHERVRFGRRMGTRRRFHRQQTVGAHS